MDLSTDDYMMRVIIMIIAILSKRCVVEMSCK
jgi:hypothetical protein